MPVVLNCKAGCDFEAVANALGFEKGDLTRPDEPVEPREPRRLRHVATYLYREPDGSLFAEKRRFVDQYGAKTFAWRRPDPDNGDAWINGTDGAIPLYRLPELIGAETNETIVVAEGERDVDRLVSLGFVATTTPNGAAAKWRPEDSQFFAARRVCVIADDDEPGRKMAERFVTALRDVALSVGFVVLPNPGKRRGFDTCDFLDDGGSIAALTEIVASFDKPKAPPEVVDHNDLRVRVLNLWEVGDEPGVYPGWDCLRNLYRPRLGELTVVTGSPNAGKSTFVDDMMVRISCGDESPMGGRAAGWRWLIYSAEQYPPQRHASKILQKLLQKPFAEGPSTRMSTREIESVWPLFVKHFTIIDPVFGGATLDRILEVAAAMKRLRGIEGLVIDPYNVVAATSRTSKTQSEHDFINEALTKMRTFAQVEHAHVIVVAHPTKLKRETEQSEYPVARPWDISGSAHWYNHSDAILSVWRPLADEGRAELGEVEVHVQKIRFQTECGALGMARLYFDRAISRYNESPRRRLERVHG